MSDKALYYPYMHFRDINWLKATLLLFSEVRRMLPGVTAPNDDETIRGFAASGLIPTTDIYSERVVHAQVGLTRRLLVDLEDSNFKERFGREATERQCKDLYGFQIHRGKISGPLLETLGTHGLAWNPWNYESYDESLAYVQVHPLIGEAVMSTLAIAAATGEGLDIVGDARSGELHNCLLEKDHDQIYEALVHPERLPPPPSATPRELFEVFVSSHCDLSDLTPEALKSLQGDREPIRKLINQMQQRCMSIPSMDQGKERDDYLKSAVSDVLTEWQADRKNMSNFWKKFWGGEVLNPAEKFVEKITEKLLSGGEAAAKGAATSGAATLISGAGLHGIATSGFLGAAAGLVLGLVSHGAKTYYRTAESERESPYRYLTIMKDSGVTFRSESGVPPPPTTVDSTKDEVLQKPLK